MGKLTGRQIKRYQYTLKAKEKRRKGPPKFRHRSFTDDIRQREPVIRLISKNVDAMIIVAAFISPPLKTGLIDRFLVMADVESVEPVIVFNKIDLVDDPWKADAPVDIYKSMGYKCLKMSALTGEGIEELRQYLTGKTSALAGHSGVGKSSILNRLEPGLYDRPEVKEVSPATNKGVHTTTAVELYRLKDGTEIFDLPGLKYASLYGIEKRELGRYFRDFEKHTRRCRYRDCLHTVEPVCGVKDALKDGSINEDRYESYLRMLETI